MNPTPGNRVIFWIKDPNGQVWSMALTKLEARIQMAWFLPKGIKYHIDVGVIPKDNPIPYKENSNG
jgi:hypothetical protein